MEQGPRSQILEVFTINTYSNSPGTNRNCFWMGGGFTIDNHTTVTFSSSRGRPILDSVCRSTSSTDFPDELLHIRLQELSRWKWLSKASCFIYSIPRHLCHMAYNHRLVLLMNLHQSHNLHLYKWSNSSSVVESKLIWHLHPRTFHIRNGMTVTCSTPIHAKLFTLQILQSWHQHHKTFSMD